MSNKKYRNYFITLNNYTDLEHTAFLQEECRYLCVGKEVGEECGTPHLHIVLCYENPKSWNALHKKYPRANIQAMEGTPEQARTYCIKDGDYIERGELPKQGKRNDIAEVKEAVEKGATMRELCMTARNYQSLRVAECMMKYFEQPRNEEVYIEYYYGATASGKTRMAYEKFHGQDYYVVTADKWFEGYDGQKNVIWDEFRDDSIPYRKLLQLTDRYQYRVECKGGSRQFKGTHIIFTSSFHPAELYPYVDEAKDQWLRRINVIKEFSYDRSPQSWRYNFKEKKYDAIN